MLELPPHPLPSSTHLPRNEREDLYSVCQERLPLLHTDILRAIQQRYNPPELETPPRIHRRIQSPPPERNVPSVRRLAFIGSFELFELQISLTAEIAPRFFAFLLDCPRLERLHILSAPSSLPQNIAPGARSPADCILLQHHIPDGDLRLHPPCRHNRARVTLDQRIRPALFSAVSALFPCLREFSVDFVEMHIYESASDADESDPGLVDNAEYCAQYNNGVDLDAEEQVGSHHIIIPAKLGLNSDGMPNSPPTSFASLMDWICTGRAPLPRRLRVPSIRQLDPKHVPFTNSQIRDIFLNYGPYGSLLVYIKGMATLNLHYCQKKYLIGEPHIVRFNADERAICRVRYNELAKTMDVGSSSSTNKIFKVIAAHWKDGGSLETGSEYSPLLLPFGNQKAVHRHIKGAHVDAEDHTSAEKWTKKQPAASQSEIRALLGLDASKRKTSNSSPVKSKPAAKRRKGVVKTEEGARSEEERSARFTQGNLARSTIALYSSVFSPFSSMHPHPSHPLTFYFPYLVFLCNFLPPLSFVSANSHAVQGPISMSSGGVWRRRIPLRNNGHSRIATSNAGSAPTPKSRTSATTTAVRRAGGGPAVRRRTATICALIARYRSSLPPPARSPAAMPEPEIKNGTPRRARRCNAAGRRVLTRGSPPQRATRAHDPTRECRGYTGRGWRWARAWAESVELRRRIVGSGGEVRYSPSLSSTPCF
ncbi:hypothetical protein DFH09DRAFT_1296997, partial [Mycena vulgaris]